MSNRRPKEVYGTEKITATKQTPAGTYKDVRRETKTTKEITIITETKKALGIFLGQKEICHRMEQLQMQRSTALSLTTPGSTALSLTMS